MECRPGRCAGSRKQEDQEELTLLPLQRYAAAIYSNVQYLRNSVYVSFCLRLVTFTFGIWQVRTGHKRLLLPEKRTTEQGLGWIKKY